MVVDEYSRFPFVFPCPDVLTTTVINKVPHFTFLVGMPAYVHSDKGASFMSGELCEFLTSKGVSSSWLQVTTQKEMVKQSDVMVRYGRQS